MREFTYGKPDRGALKAIFYGTSGSGKTLTSLKVATRLGKTVIIDSENKAGGYHPRPDMPRDYDLPPFIIERTASIIETMSIIKDIKTYNRRAKKDGTEPIKCIIVDSATLIYKSCSDKVYEEEKAKNSKSYNIWKRNGIPGINMWGKIKKPWRTLEDTLLNMDVHLFLTCRLKIDYDMDNSVKIGESASIEKDTPYAYSLLVKMERSPMGGVIATVENDVSWCMAGKKIMNPASNFLDPIIERLAPEHLKMPEGIEVKEEPSTPLAVSPGNSNITMNSVSQATPDLLITASQVSNILRLLSKRENNNPGLVEKFEKKREVVEKLTSKQGGTLLNQIMQNDFTYFT